jgi:hypothetical protein
MNKPKSKSNFIRTVEEAESLMVKIKKYLWNVLVALDQFINTLFGGDPDETISSRMGKHLIKHDKCPFCIFLCKALNLFEKDHCIKRIEADEGKDQVTKM